MHVTLMLPRFQQMFRHVLDPFGFDLLLDGLRLEPQDLPGLARERRLEGIGL